jgi:hypothetical protein
VEIQRFFGKDITPIIFNTTIVYFFKRASFSSRCRRFHSNFLATFFDFLDAAAAPSTSVAVSLDESVKCNDRFLDAPFWDNGRVLVEPATAGGSVSSFDFDDTLGFVFFVLDGCTVTVSLFLVLLLPVALSGLVSFGDCCRDRFFLLLL